MPDQMDKLKKRFGLKRVVVVGDRGMLTQTQIDALRKRPGLGWLSALRSEAIRKLMDLDPWVDVRTAPAPQPISEYFIPVIGFSKRIWNWIRQHFGKPAGETREVSQEASKQE